jgi:tetratricopeptide (TPR) repeat protein
MESGQIEGIVQRLVENPHDEDALATAHGAGASDPKSYALLLERVGTETRDPAYAAHWLSEAANVWSTTLGDAHRAARVLMQAIERDPTQRTAADRLAQLYRDKGDVKALVALLERRAKALSPLAQQSPEVRVELAAMHEELGRLWNESLQQPKKALENFRRSVELEPSAAYTMQFATALIERVAAGDSVSRQDRVYGADLLVGLAEAYDGEHGLAYSAGALDIEPGHDRALQLYAHYARALEREDDVASRYLAYIQANPAGAMSTDVRWLLAGSYEAAAQIDEAIQILEPLRGLGDGQATEKVRELYGQIGQRMPSAPPPPPSAPAPASSSSGRMRRASVATDKVTTLLDAAQSFASAGKSADAYQKYREVLEADAKHPEALSWVQDYLRTKRQYAPLRDVLLAALRVPGESVDARKERLREVAGLCEGNLRDVDGAINAWKQLIAIDRTDEAGRQALTRLLEKAQRWDDLANLMEQDASGESDIEKKIALEKKLATLHEQKRHDQASAAEALGRIANLTPEDDRAIATASKMFEKAGALDRAAQVIAENAASVSDLPARGALLERLGTLREKLGDPGGAGEAYAEAAELEKSDKLWEASERCFVATDRWEEAGRAAAQRAELEKAPAKQAAHLARSAEHLGRAGDDTGALENLERAMDLDPVNDAYGQLVAERHRDASRWDELVKVLMKGAARTPDKAKRIAAHKQAANIYANELGDKEAARDTWRKVLDDGDDRETLERLVDDSIEREDYSEATTLLRRLEDTATSPGERASIALREAELLAENVGDVDLAIVRYERIVSELDPTCRLALQAIADLQEARENQGAAAEALEKELLLVADSGDRGQIAGRLARLYEQLDDPKSAVRALEVVCKADPDDFDSLARLCDLCEKTEQWDRVAELLAARIEVEADEAEMSTLTLRLSSVLADKLNRGDEGLAALTELGDQGDGAARAAYVELGDRLGWRGIVATKLVEWWSEAKPDARRTAHLRGAFDRFAEVGRDEDAVRVACEIVRSKGADRELANRLEELSVKTKNLDALSIAHDLIAREMTGLERAKELVRQAEGRVKAGAPRPEAIQHGESGLTSVAPDEVEELLGRLAALAEEPSEVVDLYERQVSRAKAPADRAKALARAAQVAASHGQLDRARGFFDLALAGTPSDETLAGLEKAATDADALEGSVRLRRVLCDALAGAGQGARDGGRTRGAMLRRAASIARRDLDDVEQAFAWLGEALVVHVEAPTLDALEALAREEGVLRRAETTLSRALDEVFDGPLVRQLLARRAKLRRDDLDDAVGAATDLKKLHDLSPSDQAVVDELSALLTSLGDYRGLVQLFEDQILRGKDVVVRVGLARKVARMWEEELADPREAADAWRRVLRLKAGDPDATAGLERAKSNMLKRPDPSSDPNMDAPPLEAPRVVAPPPSEPEPQAERESEPEPEPEPKLVAEMPEALPRDLHEAEAVEPPPGESIDPFEPLEPPARVLDEQDEKPTVPPPFRSPETTETLTDPQERNGPPPLSAASADEAASDDDASGEDVNFDDDIEAADDMIVEVQERATPEQEPAKAPGAKRSIPPPLPRG